MLLLFNFHFYRTSLWWTYFNANLLTANDIKAGIANLYNHITDIWFWSLMVQLNSSSPIFFFFPTQLKDKSKKSFILLPFHSWIRAIFTFTRTEWEISLNIKSTLYSGYTKRESAERRNWTNLQANFCTYYTSFPGLQKRLMMVIDDQHLSFFTRSTPSVLI